MEEKRGLLLRIEAPHFTAGINWHDGLFAPIVSYMRGWSLLQIIEYCEKKGWKIDSID